jgi:hypothetical protein
MSLSRGKPRPDRKAGLDIEYSRSSVGFTWEGFEEMDEVSGDGSAELLDDGSIEIELRAGSGNLNRTISGFSA